MPLASYRHCPLAPSSPSLHSAAAGSDTIRAVIQASRASARRKPQPLPPEDIDLDRVIWDPEYRHQVRNQLNRPMPRKKRSR